MKTLKRSLALVLALVLVLGTMAFASAAGLEQFEDAGKVDAGYKTAAEVLVNLGIIEGDEGGLRPDDTITRAEACKIICFALLGKDAAEMEGMVATSTYDDIAGDEWYAMYVTYCTEKGIVSGDNGDGTGNFRPNDKITGFEFAKICMTGAIGLNSEYEGFEGGVWQLMIKMAAGEKRSARDGEIEKTIVDNIPNYNWKGEVSREVAFQMAFNALQINKLVATFGVNRDGSGYCTGYEDEDGEAGTNVLNDKYDANYVGGEIVYVAATATKPAHYAVAIEDGAVDVEDASYDQVGAPAGIWMQQQGPAKVAISDMDLAWNLLFETRDGYTLAQLTTAKNGPFANPLFCGYEKADEVIFNENGVKQDGEAEYTLGDYVALYDTNNDNKVDFVYVEKYSVKKVADVTVDKGITTVTFTDDYKAVAPVGDEVVKGDYVRVFELLGENAKGAPTMVGVLKLVDPQEVTLTKKGNNNDEEPYFNDVLYTYIDSDEVFQFVGAAPALNQKVVIYTDDSGYVITVLPVEAAPAPKDTVVYGILKAYQANGYQPKGEAGSFTQAQPEILPIEQAVIYNFNEGKQAVYDFAVSVKNGVVTFVADGVYGIEAPQAHQPANYIKEDFDVSYANSLVKVTLTPDGVIKAIEAFDAEEHKLIETPEALVNGKTIKLSLSAGKNEYSNNKTIFVLYDEKDNVKTYVGINNLPNVNIAVDDEEDLIGGYGIEAGGKIAYVLLKNGGVTEAPKAVDVIFINSTEFVTSKNADGIYLYTMKAIVNGAEKDIVIEGTKEATPEGELPEDSQVEAGKFYTGEVNKNGNYEELTESEAYDSGEVLQLEDTFFVLNGTPYYYNANTKFIKVTKTQNAYTMAADTANFAVVDGKVLNVIDILGYSETNPTKPVTTVYYSVAKAE